MQVNALDHVNIITADLGATVAFYEELFGLIAHHAPPPLTPTQAQWMHDTNNRPILHINSRDCPRTYPREVEGETTGPIHHVALACTGYDDLLARLAARGLAWQVNHVEAIGLRQVFTLDPNGVLFELNFYAD